MKEESTPGDIQSLLLDLKNPNEGRRGSAALLLGRLKDKNAIPALNAALKDKNDTVRMRAAEALGEIGDASSIYPLLDALGDSETSVWVSAGKAIVKIQSDNKVDLLIGRLEDDNSCQGVAYTLGELKDKRAIEPLSKKQTHPYIFIRREVIRALGKIGEIPNLKSLCDSLLSSDFTLQKSSLLAIEDIAELSNLQGTCVVESLLKLIKIDYSYIPWQIDPRTPAAKILGKIKDKRATEPLVELINNGKLTSSEIKGTIAKALCEIQDERSILAMMFGYRTMDWNGREDFTRCLIKWMTKEQILEILQNYGVHQISGKYMDLDPDNIKRSLIGFYLKQTDEFNNYIIELKNLICEAEQAEQFSKKHSSSINPDYPQNVRIRDIGTRLNEMGKDLGAKYLSKDWAVKRCGLNLMSEMYHSIKNDKEIPEMSFIWWNGIGDWPKDPMGKDCSVRLDY